MRRRLAFAATSIFAAMGLALAGCSPASPTTVPTLTPRPTFTASPAVPTATPAATATATPVPPTATPTPNPNINPFTGLVVTDTETLKHRPLQVVVNNMPVARPQYGLAQADLVLEYLMDGWAVTRFTALYLGQEPSRIGPVRSARLINLHIAPLFDAALVASGASVDVRWLLRNKGEFPYLDIDLDDSSNTNYSTSIGTYWETRMQTSIAGLRKWLDRIREDRATTAKPLAFSEAAPQTTSISGATVHIPYPSSSTVDWLYDSASAKYLRSVSGEKHADGATGSQLSADNVVIVYASHGKTSIVEDTLGNTAIQIGLTGDLDCILLRDGRAWEGTWRWETGLGAATIGTGDTVVVPTRSEKPLRLVAKDGSDLTLKPGSTWFQVVPTDYEVVVK